MIWKRVVADIGCSFFRLYDLVVNQCLDFSFQCSALVNGVPLHTGMVCTGFVWVDPLGRVFYSHSGNGSDVTSGFQSFIQLVDGFNNRGVLGRGLG